MTAESGKEPRPGAVRHFDELKQDWVATNPREPMFSTATMLATEFWSGTEWERIWKDDDE